MAFIRVDSCYSWSKNAMDSRVEWVDQGSPPDAKIALFRALFRGREDVFPRRFESRTTGKSGYQPACANQWLPGVCGKPRVKCSSCPHRRFLPLTDDVIRRHLTGLDDNGREFVIGVYPMLRDETCQFLAVDLDKSDWEQDVQAVLRTCLALNLPAAVERSRSGQGGHLWLFFQEALPAGLARRLGTYLLTETMERRPDIGLNSYDRLFPNQDTLPQGGLGNLIALPLQKRPRTLGNSVFLDEQWQPYEDQWAYLSTIRRIARADVERMVHNAERRGRVIGVRPAAADEVADEEDAEPWLLTPSRRFQEPPLEGPFPAGLELTLADQIYIERHGLPPGLRNRLVRVAAFQNPEFYRAQAMRLPTYDKPRVIACAEESAGHIGLPRGCLQEVRNILSGLGIRVHVHDRRCEGLPLHVAFQGTLRPEQEAAARAILAHETGVLSAVPAFGKTVIAAWLIAQRAVNTLILVHRRQLLEQWLDRLAVFLDLPRKSIGRIGGGRRTRTGSLDVAMIQSLVRRGTVDDCVAQYGQIIVDECHHVSAQSFEQVVRRAKPRYITGLSATVTRKDGHHPIVFMQCGPVRYHVDASAEAADRRFAHNVLVRPTAFRPVAPPDPDARIQFQDLCRQLLDDDRRNEMICEDVLVAVREGRSPLILTERNDHLDALAERLAGQIQHLFPLRGGARSRKTRSLMAELAAVPDDEERVLLATGRYIGEGFDDARLDTLFLTLPVSWRGTIAQYVGRLHRRHDRKREVRVYDYADLNVPMLARMFDRRCRGYEAVGYTILLPASAVPGWPLEVPLPVDPRWKSEYSASVLRLVRDGIDAPLAQLFVQAAPATPASTDTESSARSATEAFLYRRLETLPETAGRFRLNAKLPISFDGWGHMEVDLLCAEARLAVELDGAQHLVTDAYRRDRRKDMLLQEHNYFVMRFLAEDVGRHLDTVLDAILRALVHRTKA
jgi:superfamily II DNA or RNA helicase/very-short-patch-repair endonuclease